MTLPKASMYVKFIPTNLPQKSIIQRSVNIQLVPWMVWLEDISDWYVYGSVMNG